MRWRKSIGASPPETAKDSASLVHAYHDGTKHDFNRFARSLGHLDWASQPNPFRSFAGSPAFPLYPSPSALGPRGGEGFQPVTYDRLFDDRLQYPAALDARSVGDLLRHSLGLSAWKQFQRSRWSLRVNPSSGNLHPTEAYILCASMSGLADTPAVYHYAADRHAIDLRCALDPGVWPSACGATLLVALTSIHWRESWKYGERAFRYCQHDIGHAIAALTIAASVLGWRARLLPSWSHQAIAAVTGIDRDEDFVDAEREEPACVISMSAGDDQECGIDPVALVASARNGRWFGRANQLSTDHVQWTFIDEIARATENPGRTPPAPTAFHAQPVSPSLLALAPVTAQPARDARSLIVRRRSALAFDGRSSISRQAFARILSAVLRRERAPFDVLWWDARIHLALFVHRVEDLAPGLYMLLRNDGALDRLRAALRSDFEWERTEEDLPLFRLARGECRGLARRLSCDQDIAADGFFSLGMIAEFDASLREYGPSFYRHLFWESGAVGQLLYLEAEAAGARATGIGCFYDDPVHVTLGLEGHTFQSLYHFTVGMPVDDPRLMTDPGYEWERGPRSM